ncbi:SprT-like domain-containing protein [Actinoplanes oblitus]|uniref:SprT-like domain-containing protein n=1 Tax=Actinoplanes oblitus TaxID=3040509 RepID=A0ABY8WNU8_9ACTN|nr:SprT-like domain-containing protein [Actinoplanes oblitus]WIM99308.1 SprT-like domain-containing protein [Actinoplanes oblitus]
MDLIEARGLAAGLMARHGLTRWRLTFDDAKTRAGVCRMERREIGLSRPLIRLYSAEQVTETVLHEIAHALAGPGHGHDATWREIAVRIGCSGRRCVPEDAPRVDGAWEGVCRSGHRTTAHRRPVRVRSCRQCSRAFDRSALFAWTYRGHPAPLHPGYVAELGRLRTAATPAPGLTVGARVRLKGAGKYGGLVGTIVKQGRSRYQVQTRKGLLNASFAMVEPAS